MKSFSKVRLRALEPEDLDIIYRIENDPTFWQYGATTVPYSRYTLRQYLSSSQNDLFKDEQVRLVIEIQDAHGQWQSAGLADLCNFSPMHLRAEVGIIILPEYQRQGIGTQALTLLEDYARHLHLHQLYAIVAQTNHPATQLFERLDFHPSALLHDWLQQTNGFTDAILFQKMLADLHKKRSHDLY